MIAQLRGRVVAVEDSWAIVEAGGVRREPTTRLDVAVARARARLQALGR